MTVGILGYGNLGKSLANLLMENGEDFVVFSDRENNEEGREEVGIRFYPSFLLKNEAMPLDAIFLAHGSYGAYREEAISLSRTYNIISAYDIHSHLYAFQDALSPITRENKTVAIVGIGWDPGYLSIGRALSLALFPDVTPKTAWGEGVSEGHSFALRKISGVKEAIQYTLPTDTGHQRECYIVCSCEDEGRIREEVFSMKEYFSKENTNIHFISHETFEKYHKGNAYHRGRVSVQSSDGDSTFQFEVSMKRNPDFTARIMLAYLGALRRLKGMGVYGTFGPLDIPLSLLVDEDAPMLW